MSSLNDISNTDASLNSDTVPTSNIDRSDNHKHNPQTPAVAAPSKVSRPDKPDNRKGGVTGNAKGGAGAHNWGGVDDQISSGDSADTKVPAAAHLEPETEAEERRARDEAENPNPQAKTLDEFVSEGHKV